MPENKAFIKAEEASQVRQWALPELGSQQKKRFASAEKEAREAEKRRRQAEKEVVEDVTPPSAPSAEEIEAIRAEAESAGFNEGQQAGFEQGLAQGREQGLAQALAEARPELDARLQQLDLLLSGLAPPLEAQRIELQRHICALVQQLTRHLVQTELATPSEHIENLVSACISALPAVKNHTRIYVHPDDLAYLKGEAILTDQLENLELLPDDRLSPGGCRAERGASMVDASIESLLAAVLSQFNPGTEPDMDGQGGEAVSQANVNGDDPAGAASALE